MSSNHHEIGPIFFGCMFDWLAQPTGSLDGNVIVLSVEEKYIRMMKRMHPVNYQSDMVALANNPWTKTRTSCVAYYAASSNEGRQYPHLVEAATLSFRTMAVQSYRQKCQSRLKAMLFTNNMMKEWGGSTSRNPFVSISSTSSHRKEKTCHGIYHQ